MTELGKSRLSLLLATLQEHSDNGIVFDLSGWAYNLPAQKEPNVCRTSACACGLFVLKHPEEPLKLAVDLVKSFSTHYSPDAYRVLATDEVRCNKDPLNLYYEENGRAFTNFEAAARYFDINETSASSLFDADYYAESLYGDDVPIESVIARVEECLKSGHISYASIDELEDYDEDEEDDDDFLDDDDDDDFLDDEDEDETMM